MSKISSNTETMDGVYSLLMENEIIDSAVNTITGKVVGIAIIIALMLYFISLAYNYVKNVLDKLQGGDNTSFIDIKELIRVLVLIGCITMYPVISNALVGTLDFFRYLSSPAGSTYAAFSEVAEKYTQVSELFQGNMDEAMLNDVIAHPEKYNERTVEFAQQEKRRLEDLKAANQNMDEEEVTNKKNSRLLEFLTYLDPAKMIPYAMKVLVGFLTGVVKLLVGMLTTMMLKIMIILGPLAFAFSILPVFKGKLEEWFGTTLTIGFVFITYNILDALFYAHLHGIANAEYGVVTNGQLISNVAFELTFLIAYIMIFWLTSKYVGKGDAGRFMSKAVGLMTVAAMALMTGGTSAAASGGSQIGNVASAAGDSFKSEE